MHKKIFNIDSKINNDLVSIGDTVTYMFVERINGKPYGKIRTGILLKRIPSIKNMSPKLIIKNLETNQNDEVHDGSMIKIISKIQENLFRKKIRKHLFECMMDEFAMLGEERITNDEALSFAQRKENFVASHLFGEQVGLNYVIMSYTFPLFIYDSNKDRWYENSDRFLFNGEPIENTETHRAMVRPTIDTRTKSLNWMNSKLEKIKHEAGIKELTHTEAEPGTKN